jgi:F-type H+-transporting ATPase subunit b
VSVNATLFVEVLAFLLFIYSFKRFLWAPILVAMQRRDARIANGLAAAERGHRDLEDAKAQVSGLLKEAHEKSLEIVEQAHRRANQMLEQARTTAAAEGQRLATAAQQQIELEARQVRESLRREIAQLAVDTAAKLLEREIDARAHADLIAKLAAEI